MKTIFVLPVVLMSILHPIASHAAFGVPSDSQLDKAVSIAIHPDFNNGLEKNKGSFSCKPLMEPFAWDGYAAKTSTDRLKASGKSQEFAQTFSQLKCMREACELLPDATNAKAVELSQDEKKVRDILVQSGLNEEQIKLVMGKTKNGVGNKLSCATSANMRTMAYDFCVTVPYECTSGATVGKAQTESTESEQEVAAAN